MADLQHEWGSDIALSADGDLALSDGPQAARERVLRRLLTNPGDYIFDMGYGAGLPAEVGETTSSQQIQASARRQMFAEPGVGQDPPPSVRVTPIFSGVTVHVRFHDTESGEPVALGFDLER